MYPLQVHIHSQHYLNTLHFFKHKKNMIEDNVHPTEKKNFSIFPLVFFFWSPSFTTIFNFENNYINFWSIKKNDMGQQLQLYHAVAKAGSNS